MYGDLLTTIESKKGRIDQWTSLLDSEGMLNVEQTSSNIEQSLRTLSLEETKRHTMLQDALENLRGPLHRTEMQNEEVLSGVNETKDLVHQMRDEIRDEKQEHERLSILQWLSTEPYMAHHDEIYKKVLKGTGAWLLSHSQFLEWQRSSASSILWLHGIPGSGKSCLSCVE